MCKPIKVGTPVDEGFKLMKDVRVDKTMVNGKAVFKTKEQKTAPMLPHQYLSPKVFHPVPMVHRLEKRTC
jgi:hypothetical protein